MQSGAAMHLSLIPHLRASPLIPFCPRAAHKTRAIPRSAAGDYLKESRNLRTHWQITSLRSETSRRCCPYSGVALGETSKIQLSLSARRKRRRGKEKRTKEKTARVFATRWVPCACDPMVCREREGFETRVGTYVVSHICAPPSFDFLSQAGC